MQVRFGSRSNDGFWSPQQSLTSTSSRLREELYTLYSNVLPITENAGPYQHRLRGFSLVAIAVQHLHHKWRNIDFLAFVGHDEGMLQELHVVWTFLIIFLQAKQTTRAHDPQHLSRQWQVLSGNSCLWFFSDLKRLQYNKITNRNIPHTPLIQNHIHLRYTQWTRKKRGSLFLTITLANLNRFL